MSKKRIRFTVDSGKIENRSQDTDRLARAFTAVVDRYPQGLQADLTDTETLLSLLPAKLDQAIAKTNKLVEQGLVDDTPIATKPG